MCSTMPPEQSPPAAEEESALRQELAAWAMPVLTSAGAELPRRIYHLEANDLQFKELSFASQGDHVELSLDGETLRAGFGFQADNLLTWREALPRRVAASVRRISDREFELLACCYETPFQWHIQLEFGDDAVTLVRRANVCFRTADWPVLRGRRS